MRLWMSAALFLSCLAGCGGERNGDSEPVSAVLAGAENDTSLPVQGWLSVAAGFRHTVAIRDDATLWACGFNKYGQLGDGTTDHRDYFVQVGTGSDWAEISAGKYHTLARKGDGTLWAWGRNKYGELGDGTKTIRRVPTAVAPGTTWTSVSAGRYHTVAISTDGKLWSWGFDETSISVPDPVSPETGWTSVSAGYGFTLALKQNGTLWGWGANEYGQLGDGTATSQGALKELTVGYTWSAISAGKFHSLGVLSDGSLLRWGRYENGAGYDPVPEQIGLQTNWVSVTAGAEFGFALDTEATLWGWGWNDQGQVDAANLHTFVAQPNTVGDADTWAIVDAGEVHAVAIKTDGSFVAWGKNDFGQLGN